MTFTSFVATGVALAGFSAGAGSSSRSLATDQNLQPLTEAPPISLLAAADGLHLSTTDSFYAQGFQLVDDLCEQ